ncbi:DinB family protein [Stieleria marina]|uniref:DinB superfamily protein n=1 Tax=Stieleria marina TaxID=1930275 RepID=A0A517NWN2_9BACT|nr:DinB superfamily protein [Planctomycetes bacterium K23_9]
MTNLARPGAGLPKPELVLARAIFRLKCWRTSPEEALVQFQQDWEAVTAICAAYDPSQASKQVLIDRLRGLEDSSRDWSIYMTVEHLRIVNDAIANVCSRLADGGELPREVGTADVKPSPKVGREVVTAFDQSCTLFVETLSSIDNLKTNVRFKHPWFGPLDGSRWLVLAAFHMRLHLKQLHRIGEGLRSL